MSGSAFDNLSGELKEKIRKCATDEEMKNILDEADIELDPDALEAVSGGDRPIHNDPKERLNCPAYKPPRL